MGSEKQASALQRQGYNPAGDINPPSYYGASGQSPANYQHLQPVQPMQPAQPIQQIGPMSPVPIELITAPVFYLTPVAIVCPHCNFRTMTATSNRVGLYAGLLGFGLFMFGFPLCSFLPCMTNSTKDIVHSCGHCGKAVGTYRQL